MKKSNPIHEAGLDRQLERTVALLQRLQAMANGK